LIVASFPWATTPFLFVLAGIMFGAAIGYLGPAPAAIIADITPPGATGAIMGLYRAAGDIGLLLGPIMVGWVAGHVGLQSAFFVAAGCAILVALMGIGVRETLVLSPPVVGQHIAQEEKLDNGRTARGSAQ
jgi:MFS family permease